MKSRSLLVMALIAPVLTLGGMGFLGGGLGKLVSVSGALMMVVVLVKLTAIQAERYQEARRKGRAKHD